MPIEIRPSDVMFGLSKVLSQGQQLATNIFNTEAEKERVKEVNDGLILMKMEYQKNLEAYQNPKKTIEFYPEVEDPNGAPAAGAVELRPLGDVPQSAVMAELDKQYKALEEQIIRSTPNKKAQAELLYRAKMADMDHRSAVLGEWRKAASGVFQHGINDYATLLTMDKTTPIEKLVEDMQDRIAQGVVATWLTQEQADAYMVKFEDNLQKTRTLNTAITLATATTEPMVVDTEQGKATFEKTVTPEQALQNSINYINSVPYYQRDPVVRQQIINEMRSEYDHRKKQEVDALGIEQNKNFNLNLERIRQWTGGMPGATKPTELDIDTSVMSEPQKTNIASQWRIITNDEALTAEKMDLAKRSAAMYGSIGFLQNMQAGGALNVLTVMGQAENFRAMGPDGYKELQTWINLALREEGSGKAKTWLDESNAALVGQTKAVIFTGAQKPEEMTSYILNNIKYIDKDGNQKGLFSADDVTELLKAVKAGPNATEAGIRKDFSDIALMVPAAAKESYLKIVNDTYDEAVRDFERANKRIATTEERKKMATSAKLTALLDVQKKTSLWTQVDTVPKDLEPLMNELNEALTVTMGNDIIEVDKNALLYVDKKHITAAELAIKTFSEGWLGSRWIEHKPVADWLAANTLAAFIELLPEAERPLAKVTTDPRTGRAYVVYNGNTYSLDIQNNDEVLRQFVYLNGIYTPLGNIVRIDKNRRWIFPPPVSVPTRELIK